MRRNALSLSFAAKAISFAASAGLLVYFISASSEYIRGDILISYSKPVGNATELVLTSTCPVDRKIESLRFAFINDPEFVTKQQTIARVHQDGTLDLPDSPSEVMRWPAKEYSDLDGSIIPSKGVLTFRLPPFTNSPVVAFSGGVVELTVATRPAFGGFRWFEDALKYFGVMNAKRSQRFLVQESHWTPVPADYAKDIQELSCREKWTGPLSYDTSGTSGCRANDADLDWGPTPHDTGDAFAPECTKHPEITSPFTTVTEHRYIIGGKVRGTADRPDRTGRPLILFVIIDSGIKVVCERGRFVLFYDSLEPIRYFWRK